MPIALSQSVVITELHAFSGGADGKYPNSQLVEAPNGNFYGVTQFGGADNDGGTVFEITPSGVLTTIHSFTGGGVAGPVVAAGNHPFGSLIIAADGNIYGTTMRGGAGQCSNGGSELGCGSIFGLTLTGALTSIYAFTGLLDGSTPSGVIQGSDGDLYGTTLAGAGSAVLTPPIAYRLTLAGSFSTLDSFSTSGGPATGAKLIQAADGNFYGTTVFSGNSNEGTVFQLTPLGLRTTLHDFSGPADGIRPFAPLVEGRDGNFYGTAQSGGIHDVGTVFRISSSGTFSVLHHFAGGNEGAYPITGLVQGGDGTFYGTTSAGGTGDRTQCAAGCGTIFRVSTAGVFNTLYSFPPASGGPVPNALIEGRDGALYGTTLAGGPTANGTVYKITVTAAPPVPPPPPGGGRDGGGGGGGVGKIETSLLLLFCLLASARSFRWHLRASGRA